MLTALGLQLQLIGLLGGVCIAGKQLNVLMLGWRRRLFFIINFRPVQPDAVCYRVLIDIDSLISNHR